MQCLVGGGDHTLLQGFDWGEGPRSLYADLALGDCTRKKIKSVSGKLVWLARPHVGWAPIFLGAYVHMLWGAHYLSRTPLALLLSLASLWVFTFSDRSPLTHTPRCELDWSHSLFVDAASQAHSFCWGWFGPSIGTRFGWCDGSIHNQQAAELFGLWAATRLAVHRGWKHRFLFRDNEASIKPGFGT